MRTFVGKEGMKSEDYSFQLREIQQNVYRFYICHVPTQEKYEIISHGVNWDQLKYKFREIL